jgi:hypothetical protein
MYPLVLLRFMRFCRDMSVGVRPFEMHRGMSLMKFSWTSVMVRVVGGVLLKPDCIQRCYSVSTYVSLLVLREVGFVEDVIGMGVDVSDEFWGEPPGCVDKKPLEGGEVFFLLRSWEVSLVY